jgi:hypothetical protein
MRFSDDGVVCESGARMRTLTMLIAAGFILSLFPVEAEAQTTGVQYQLILDCPAGGGLYLVNNPLARSPGMMCPIRAIDADDQMGDPSLAVDPFEPENLILASLHGTSNCGGPSIKSRCRQPFTTFTSTNNGATWSDKPFFPPPDVGSPSFGQHPQVTIDPYGRVYVGSLYARGAPNSENFNYIMVAQKFSNLQNINREQNGAYNAEYLDPVYMGNQIGQMWFLFNPQTDNMTMVWHENVTKISQPKLGRDNNNCIPPPPPKPVPSSTTTTTSSSNTTTSRSPAEISAYTRPIPTPSLLPSQKSAPDLVSAAPSVGQLAQAFGASPQILPAVLADEADAQAEETSAAALTPQSVIGVVWTGSSLKSCYQYQPHKWVIGPCLKSTNPVLSEGWLYVGCVATTEEGNFTYNPKAVHGQVEMFRMNPDGGEPQYIGSSPIHGGSPKLGVRSDGRLALATANATEDGRLDVKLAFGKYNDDLGRIVWSSSRGYGTDIAKVDPAIRIVEANVQDLIFREHSGVLHFILKTKVKPSGAVIDELRDSLMPDFRKSIIAVSEEFGVLAKVQFDIGNPQNRTDGGLRNAHEEAYNDLSDDYLQLPEQPLFEYTDAAGRVHQLEHYQREFFAIGDYGVIMFGEIIELTNLKGPAFPQPGTEVPPQPAAATTTTTTNVTVPAAGLTMAGALALAVISNKRKEAAVVRARRKRQLM